MARPGLSSTTRPAVTTLLNRVVGVRGAIDTLYRSPAAENVASTALAALFLMHSASELIESLGLDPQDIMTLWRTTPDDAATLEQIVALIRSKSK